MIDESNDARQSVDARMTPEINLVAQISAALAV
jgi:hypothetical protein